jgi:hypothetical protein
MKKHSNSKIYFCPVQNCDSTFYRLDKLRLHIWRVHEDDELASCPLGPCRAVHSLLLLRVHVLSHSTNENNCREWALIEKRTCPVGSCRKTIEFARFHEHIWSHSSSEREENKDAVEAAGYDWTCGNVICPICKTRLASHSDFSEHLTTSHLVVDASHFRAFRASCQTFNFISMQLPWKPWELHSQKDENFACTYCHEDELGFTNSAYGIAHHLNLLADEKSIKPHRQAILRLWPEFRSHSVFEDVRPGVSRASHWYIW